ncbi:MAG: HYR domain-containing protein, partial [Chitinophagaceae bacterium]
GVHSLQVTAASGGFVDYFYKVASGGCSATGWTCIGDASSPETNIIGTLTAGVEYYILVDAEVTTSVTQTFQINCPVIDPCTNDIQAPTITCPGNITVNAAAGQCSEVVSYGAITATDNCTAPTITRIAGLASGSTFPIGVTTVTYQAADAAGNTAQCSFTVTVNDTQTPTITCPGNITVNAAAGLCSAVVNYGAIASSDNCTAPTITRTAGLASGSAFPVGVTTVTYQAADAAGNTAQCSFTVTVNDTEAPTITCPANITANAAAGLCSAVVNYGAITASDNCTSPIITRTAGLASGSVFPVGVTTVTYQAADAAGNTAQCSFTVTVNDTQAPTITCPANVSRTTDPGVCIATFAPVNPTATDNCAVTLQTWAITGVTTATSPATGINTVGSRAFNIGVSTITYTVKDAAGNTNTCSQTITITDAQLPTITTQPANRTVCAGSNATFTAVAVTAPTAGGPLSYLWQSWTGSAWVTATGGSGGTTNTFTLSNVTQSMNTNSYRVQVIGLCTTVNSAFATLYVNPLPTINLTTSIPPALLPTQVLTITATTNPSGGSYVWFKNGVVIPGVTGNTLAGLTVSDIGNYYVVYTDLNGCVVTSATIAITGQPSDNLYVYPVPNYGVFNVRFYNQTNEQVTVRVFDAKGAQVYSRKVLTTVAYTTINVDLSTNKVLPKGTYVVEVRGAEGKLKGSKKIIVY